MRRPVSPTVARLVGIRNVFTGEVGKERTADDALRLAWEGHSLETAIRDGPAPGTAVAWCIGDDGVIVHRRDRPSLGERENPVAGTVREAVRLGATTELVIDVSEDAAQPVHCAIPTHVAWRNGIERGVKIGFSLRAAAIHIMPQTGT
jgi:molybdate transport system ATP-binding protein